MAEITGIIPTTQEKSNTSSELQIIFENLIQELITGSEREVNLSGDPIQTESAEIQQQLFASRRSSEIPDLGAKLISPIGSASYYLTFFESSPSAYGKTWVAENRMKILNGKKTISTPLDIAEINGEELSSRYDRAIVQAAANIFNKTILHSFEIGFGTSAQRSKLQTEGYSQRSGYPQIMDKFFSPQH